jgi:hypothetical protein
MNCTTFITNEHARLTRFAEWALEFVEDEMDEADWLEQYILYCDEYED